MRAATRERMSLINLLSDAAHPTEAVADVLKIAEEFSKGDVTGLAGLEVAYVGDATNVTRSLAVALLRLGVNVRVGSPSGYQLTPGGVEDPFEVEGPGSLRLCERADEAVRGADVVYTDAWVSMGFEEESARRRHDLASFQVNEELMGLAKDRAIVMHCLPAHRGDEITNEVLDGEQSRVWGQVFHRRSAMIGVLRWIKGESMTKTQRQHRIGELIDHDVISTAAQDRGATSRRRHRGPPRPRSPVISKSWVPSRFVTSTALVAS